MACFAVMLSTRPTTRDGILLMLNELREAEEIASELRLKGHPVVVREITSATGGAQVEGRGPLLISEVDPSR